MTDLARRARPPMLDAKAAAAIAEWWASASDVYATVVEGDCMSPLVERGACVAVDPIAQPLPGDLVILVRKPSLIRGGEPPGVLKRLVAPLERTRIPYHPTGAEEVEPSVTVEMLNPRRRLQVPYSVLAAVHFCLGEVPEHRGSVLVDWDRVAEVRARSFTREEVAAARFMA